ncbi:putative lipopolysaccharide heptosyltransferase III [Photobacterium sanguinicancri]|uniref:Lipopolysaccharide heptosyltransferase III n=1 Tax=Photobacterium sanguinicancri TaxID=875932 RepID=A0ABX4FUF1_9GAMM|nr:putative lipopolysaccharide heptosyltransferase III [Photobacterium sanguinicancri]OZS42506.1 putative lipopolysaccharide heptosyltransferase III [Photobacterium sanguinicancri]
MTTSPLYDYLPHPIDWAKVQRVLVIKLRHHGDVLLSSPVYQTLKNHHPHLTVDALVYTDTAPMLQGHPAIDTLHSIDKKWKKLGTFKHIAHEAALIKTLRHQQYDLVINLTESRRGAWIKWATKAQYGVAGNYKNRQDKSWKKAFPIRYHLPRFGNTRHTVEVHLDALRKAGLIIKPQDKPLILELSEQEYQTARQLRSNVDDKNFIVLHPTSRWLFKTWRIEHYRSLIQQLLADGHQVVITAAPDKVEMGLVEGILDGISHPSLHNLAGQLSLRSLAATIAQAKLMVGVDSVPMHIAAAVDTPCVALFGPSGDIEWAPWSDKARVLTSNHTCRPCGYDGCGGGKISECLASISVDTVYQAIQEQLTDD